MKLNKVTLKNFRQHKHREIDVSGNLIGIIGPNGSGKSNLLNGIQFGLVGDVPDINRDKLLTWGAEDGYVELLVNDDITIHRSVSTIGAKLSASSGSIRNISGIASVNRAVKDMFGLDKDLARQTIFVRQAEIDSVLFETPAKREQAFQKLCGMGPATTIYKKAGDIISTKFREPPSYDPQINELKAQLQVEEARLKDLEATHKACTIDISAQDITNMKVMVTDSNNLVTKLRNALYMYGELEAFSKQITDAESELCKIPEVKATDIDVLADNIAGMRKLLTDVQKYIAAKTDLDARIADKTKLSKPPVTDAQIKALEDQCAKLQADFQRSQANKAMLTNIYNAIFKAAANISTCPICHSVIEDPEEVKAQLAADIASNNVVEPIKQQADLQVAYAKVVTFNNNVVKSDAAVASAEKLLASFSELEGVDIDAEAVAQEIANMEAALTQSRKYLNTRNNCTSRLEVLKGTFNTTRDKIMAVVTAVKDILPAEKVADAKSITATIEAQETDVKALQETIDLYNSQMREYGLREGTIKELVSRITDSKALLAQLEEKREASKNFNTVFTTLTNVRDWFHYKNGPRALSSSILNDMAGGINTYLDTFEAPFVITPQLDAGLDFNCVFKDGRNGSGEINASDLSGGEKILLATSFRLASYCMFAQELGLLSLDEPTVYLDDQNITKFCTFLSKVKEVLTTLDLQIFIATHERSVIPYLDTVIDLQD